MSEANNLIDLSADEILISTSILRSCSSPALNINKNNSLNKTPHPSTSIPEIYPVLVPGPGKFITLADARNSLDNNPFDRIQKEANLQDDPFEMVFNEIDKSGKKITNSPMNKEVITENLLLFSDDSENILQIPKFSRLDSGSGQLSSVSSIGSINNSIFGENISSIKYENSLNTGLATENTSSSVNHAYSSDNTGNSDNNELNKGFMLTKNIFNSSTVKDNSKIDMQLNNDKINFKAISNFTSEFSSIGFGSSSETLSLCNSSLDLLQNNDSSSILNKKFIADSTVDISNNIFNKGFIETTQSTGNSKENLSKNIYSTPPDGQSTPNRDLNNSSSSNSSGGGNNIQLKSQKYDIRNRLLKLSISNSSINSPLANYRKNSNSSLELSVFNEASNIAELYSQLITSSLSSNNITEDSCDDLMAIQPNWIDSKSDIESDLELLKIPCLAEFDNSNNISNNNANNNNNDGNIIKTTIGNDEKSTKDFSETEPITSDLDKLKEKFKQHKIKNNIQDINSMISGLKGLIFECTEDEKKNEASNLLESLSTLLGDDKKNIEKSSCENKKDNRDENLVEPVIPPPIIRQGTFDLDLKHDDDLPGVDEGTIIAENLDNIKVNDDNLQEEEEIQPELANIVEQIGKFLGGVQNVNVVTAAHLNQNSIDSKILNTNPTYIVVVGTPSKKRLSNNNYDIKSPSNETEIRKRSQSLSLYDKKLKLQSTGTSNKKTYHITSPPKNESHTLARSANSIGRRNSISTTTVTPIRRSIYGQTTIPKTANNQKPSPPQLQQRRSMLVAGTGPKNISGKPIVNFRNDFTQIKFKSSNELTQRSKGPLKATIPIKRVAPLTVTSSVSSPNDDLHIYNNKPITSTPLSMQPKSSNNKNLLPKACSTPMVVVSSSTNDHISPTRNSYKNRMKYSYASSATPNYRSNLSVQSSSSIGQNNRRRSFSDSRSPIKRPLQQQEECRKTLKNLKFGTRAAAKSPNAPPTLSKENKQPRFGF